MNRRGLTVLEVLIGVILLVLGAIPLLALFQSQEQETGLIVERLMVTNHLRRELDRLESRSIATRFTSPTVREGPAAVHVGGKREGITVQVTRQLEPSDLVPGLSEARVTARWKDRELDLTRLVADPERSPK